MTLSFAGVTLPVVTEALATDLERYINPDDLYPWADNLTGSSRIGWTIQGAPVWKRKVKLGSLYWPTGCSRWATGYFIADDAALAAIRRSVSPGSPAALVLGDGLHTVSVTLYMLPPRPLRIQPNGNGLWLLIFVDQRYFFWRGTDHSLAGGLFQTWSNLILQVGTALGVTLTYDPIAPAYLQPSLTTNSLASQLPPFLDGLAYNIGQRVVFGLDGLIKLQGYANANTQYQANKSTCQIMAGGEMFSPASDAAGLLPASLTFLFLMADRAFNTTGWEYSPSGQVGGSYDSILYSPYKAVQAYAVSASTLSLPAGVTYNSHTHTIREEGWACVTLSGSTWDNESTCVALANQFAQDWYSFQLSAADIVYAGIAPWTPEGLSDSIEWTYRADMVSTRVQRPAYNDTVEDLHHFTTSAVAPYAQFIVAGVGSAPPVTGPFGLAYLGVAVGPPVGSDGVSNGSPIWVGAAVDTGGAGNIGQVALEGGKCYPAQLVGIDGYGQRIYRVVSTLTVLPGNGGTGVAPTITQQLRGDIDNLISFEHPYPGIDALKLQGETLDINVISPTNITSLSFIKGLLAASGTGVSGSCYTGTLGG